ncbi:MAG: hypothetical protein J7M19_01980, partial [Planctomycetes bacterium]|nr:hypothetical protein [Planctomycetota bacterium]
CAWAQAGEEAESHSEVFEILKSAEDGGESADTLSSAVDTFDGALKQVQSGELAAVRSNLAYNRKRLDDLSRQAAAKREYLDDFWQKVAVYFENLKSQYGQEADSPEYRKAVISLRQEYEQQEAQAKTELARLEENIAITQKRIQELTRRETLAMLDVDLRSENLSELAAEEKRPTPTRADEAIEAMEDLSKKMREKRVQALLENIEIRSTCEEYWQALARDLTKGK